MNAVARPWRMRVLGLVTLVALSGCTVTGEGYVGAVYEPPGYDYDGWQAGYYVAPPRGEHRGERGDEHRDEHGGARNDQRRPEPSRAPKPAPPRTYRPAPPSRPAPSIPTRPAPPVHERNHH